MKIIEINHLKINIELKKIEFIELIKMGRIMAKRYKRRNAG